jgi:predicted small secreted protein
MKKLFLFPLIFVALALSACGTLRGSGNVITETREIGRFDEINLAGIGEVIITQGDEVSLKIEAEDNIMRYLKSEVQGGALTLSLRQPAAMVSVWPTQPIKFYVTVTDLEAITVAGSGDVSAEAITAKSMALRVLGSGDIHLEALDSDDVTVTIAGSGDVKVDDLAGSNLITTITGSGTCTLQGEVTEQGVRIAGSGDYRADNLQSEDANVTIAGSGSSYVNVSDSLDVRITGSGDVRYSGSPRLTQSIIGSGDVVARP